MTSIDKSFNVKDDGIEADFEVPSISGTFKETKRMVLPRSTFVAAVKKYIVDSGLLDAWVGAEGYKKE